jgi:hypothetical protein
VLAALAAPAAAGAKRAYTVTPGPLQEVGSFSASYKGAGAYHTAFAAHPSNPGGADDRNTARDRSRQAWRIRYDDRIDVPRCTPAFGEFDPCAGIAGLDGARGATRMTGWVRHRHVDGLFSQLDATLRCRLRSGTTRADAVAASIGVRYDPATRKIGITAFNPMATAILLFQGFCSEMPDGIDRMYNFYAMPGFDFASAYGSDRWFASREVLIPAAAFRRARRIRIPLHVTSAGRSPAGCGLLNPSYERCHTGGTWKGVLTLRARP